MFRGTFSGFCARAGYVPGAWVAVRDEGERRRVNRFWSHNA
jgi:hypothetical protein